MLLSPALVSHALSTLATAAGPQPQFVGWRPFHTPMPIWDLWFWTLLPLAAGIALVYKTTKTDDVNRVPAESVKLTLWIVLGLIGAAAAIAIVVRMS